MNLIGSFSIDLSQSTSTISDIYLYTSNIPQKGKNSFSMFLKKDTILKIIKCIALI